MTELVRAALAVGLLGLLGTGCASAKPAVPAEPATPAPSALPVPVERARQDLARRLGADADHVVVVAIDDVVWPDSCLGLSSPELCAPGATPGYAVVFRLSGKEYRYHTDRYETYRYAGPGDAPAS